jgi:hypothetical protein
MSTPPSSPDFADVVDFATWFINQRFYGVIPFMNSESINYGPIARTVLYRKGGYQVEMWMVWPGETSFPEHLHPDVDTVEIHLSGDIHFTLNGEPMETNLALPLDNGATMPAIRIRQTDVHQATAGMGGAVFLSCQHWLHDVPPASVALNWDGPEFSPVQASLRKH